MNLLPFGHLYDCSFVRKQPLQENVKLSGDGYQGDVIGESTPDVLVSEFVCFFSYLLSLITLLLLFL